jgi:hypothetical protein
MVALPGLGRLLVIIGATLLLLGVSMLWGFRIPWLGHLPGDFVIRGSNVKVYIPLGTCLLISVVVSLILWVFGRR